MQDLAAPGLGGGAGAIFDHEQKKEIKADVEDVLPPGSSGIVAVFEERWVADVEKGAREAEMLTRTASTAAPSAR
jgi:hypothetical protein